MALKELSVTLYTMMKGTAPLFVLGWGSFILIGFRTQPYFLN